jgi:hypothetical protein
VPRTFPPRNEAPRCTILSKRAIEGSLLRCERFSRLGCSDKSSTDYALDTLDLASLQWQKRASTSTDQTSGRALGIKSRIGRLGRPAPRAGISCLRHRREPEAPENGVSIRWRHLRRLLMALPRPAARHDCEGNRRFLTPLPRSQGIAIASSVELFAASENGSQRLAVQFDIQPLHAEIVDFPAHRFQALLADQRH